MVGCDWSASLVGDANSVWLLGARQVRVPTPAQPVALTMANLDGDRCPDVVAGLADASVMIIWGRKKGDAPVRILRPPGGHAGGNYGLSLAAYRNILAVGAPDDGDPGARGSGAVYLYAFAGREPGRARRISQNTPGVAGNSEAGDHWGWSLAVGRFPKGSGMYLAVGAPEENTDGAGTQNHKGVPAAGAVTLLFEPMTEALHSRRYTYQRGRVPGARYGYALASGTLDEESYLLVGALGANAVEVITIEGPRPLEVSNTLRHPQPGTGFGAVLAMADGRAVIGMPGADEGLGAVSVGSVSPNARPATVLSAPGIRPEDRFGLTVTVGGNLTITVGAPGHTGTGAVVQYDLDTLTMRSWLKPPPDAVRFGGALGGRAPTW
ncbi:hypothetical protein [Acrocarpospora catenulata]|uniref:hypothetical protein n=1 Tax=Acrocarpospora catenulata TaxID=2836182 RepID=UPI001BDB46D7|nr:hypothetical protein [Acrocarpospora catenulata]